MEHYSKPDAVVFLYQGKPPVVIQPAKAHVPKVVPPPTWLHIPKIVMPPPMQGSVPVKVEPPPMQGSVPVKVEPAEEPKVTMGAFKLPAKLPATKPKASQPTPPCTKPPPHVIAEYKAAAKERTNMHPKPPCTKPPAHVFAQYKAEAKVKTESHDLTNIATPSPMGEPKSHGPTPSSASSSANANRKVAPPWRRKAQECEEEKRRYLDRQEVKLNKELKQLTEMTSGEARGPQKKKAKVEAPAVEAPKVEDPQEEAPKVEVPEVEVKCEEIDVALTDPYLGDAHIEGF